MEYIGGMKKCIFSLYFWLTNEILVFASMRIVTNSRNIGKTIFFSDRMRDETKMLENVLSLYCDIDTRIFHAMVTIATVLFGNHT